MQCARMPPLEPVDTAGRLSWTKHTAQEELCHLARFAISLAALALTCKAVSRILIDFEIGKIVFIRRKFRSQTSDNMDR